MKIHGKKITGSNFEYVVLPRPDGQIVFKAEAVLDDSEFEEVCKKPTPPLVTKPGQPAKPDFEDKAYRKACEKRGHQYNDWLVLKSLSATPGLEWETVKIGEPDTYANYEKELRDSGISSSELLHIIQAVHSANSLDEKKLEAARKSFLAGLVVKEEVS